LSRRPVLLLKHIEVNTILISHAKILRYRWENNIKMDLQEIGLESVDWVHLAQDRDQWHTLVNTEMEFWVP
jgi:hypothetical protein